MPELRRVDPRSLKPNPDNPRTVAVPKEMDAQLTASIAAIGLIQPPVVREINGELVVRAGDRRTRCAIAAGKQEIDVYVWNGDETTDPMVAVSENLVRVGMNPVDTWRAIDKLEQQGWNEDAIAAALALPARTVRKLKLLGRLHPPMLDCMGKGSMPSDEQLRTIAAASAEDQAQVWKRYKPKKGHDVVWWEIARALGKPRIPFSAARFDEDLARAHGVVWEDDLFAPAGEDGRYTTNVDGFFGAQQEWLANNLPERGVILVMDDYGQPELPKKAERTYGKPQKTDIVGHYIDQRSGEVKTVAYRMPRPTKSTKARKTSADSETPDDTVAVAKQRPDVTQKGLAMIGDFRTDALHRALDDESIPADTLIGLLVLALAAKNVSIESGRPYGFSTQRKIGAAITEGGVLTADTARLHAAARDMLKFVLSCRANATDSGINSRIVGESLQASVHLPSMATDEFLSCLSRQALERNAAANGIAAQARVRDTRAGMVERFKDAVWHFPGALFALTEAEIQDAASYAADWDGEGEGLDGSEPGSGATVLDGASDDPDADDEQFAVAAE